MSLHGQVPLDGGWWLVLAEPYEQDAMSDVDAFDGVARRRFDGAAGHAHDGAGRVAAGVPAAHRPGDRAGRHPSDAVGHDDVAVLLVHPDRILMASVLAAGGEETPRGVLARALGASARASAERPGAVVDLGEVEGIGWQGSVAREYLSPAGVDGEQQLTATLGAADSYLVLTVRHPGPDGEAAAMELIRATLHPGDAA